MPLLPRRVTLNVIINPSITSISLLIEERGGEQPVRVFACFVVGNVPLQWVHLETVQDSTNCRAVGRRGKNHLMESWEHL